MTPHDRHTIFILGDKLGRSRHTILMDNHFPWDILFVLFFAAVVKRMWTSKDHAAVGFPSGTDEETTPHHPHTIFRVNSETLFGTTVLAVQLVVLLWRLTGRDSDGIAWAWRARELPHDFALAMASVLEAHEINERLAKVTDAIVCDVPRASCACHRVHFPRFRRRVGRTLEVAFFSLAHGLRLWSRLDVCLLTRRADLPFGFSQLEPEAEPAETRARFPDLPDKPNSQKDKSRLHQLGKKMLTGFFTGCALHTGGGWTDWEELEKHVASEVRVNGFKSREAEVNTCERKCRTPMCRRE